MIQLKTPLLLIFPLFYMMIVGAVLSATGDFLVREERVLSPASMEIAAEAQYAAFVPANQWEVIDLRRLPLIQPVAEMSTLETVEAIQQTQTAAHTFGACSGGR